MYGTINKIENAIKNDNRFTIVSNEHGTMKVRYGTIEMSWYNASNNDSKVDEETGFSFCEFEINQCGDGTMIIFGYTFTDITEQFNDCDFAVTSVEDDQQQAITKILNDAKTNEDVINALINIFDQLKSAVQSKANAFAKDVAGLVLAVIDDEQNIDRHILDEYDDVVDLLSDNDMDDQAGRIAESYDGRVKINL